MLGESVKELSLGNPPPSLDQFLLHHGKLSVIRRSMSSFAKATEETRYAFLHGFIHPP